MRKIQWNNAEVGRVRLFNTALRKFLFCTRFQILSEKRSSALWSQRSPSSLKAPPARGANNGRAFMCLPFVLTARCLLSLVQVYAYAVKCLSQCWNVKFNNVHCLASLVAGLAGYRDDVGHIVVDDVLEDIRAGMEVSGLTVWCGRCVSLILLLSISPFPSTSRFQLRSEIGIMLSACHGNLWKFPAY